MSMSTFKVGINVVLLFVEMCIGSILKFATNCINVLLFVYILAQQELFTVPLPYIEVTISYSMDDCEIQFDKDSLYIEENDIHDTFTCNINSSQHSILMVHCNMRSLSKNHERLE